jgi:hypothetical protein
MTNPDPNTSPSPAADAYAPPTAPLPAPPPLRSPTDVTTGQRIGGALLITNAILVLLEAGLMPADPNPTPLTSPGRTLIPALVDIVIGISLLSKNRKFLPWAIVRVVFGLVVFTAIYATKDPFLAVMQVTVSGSLLLLLVGDAGKPRMAIGGALFGLYALTSILGLGATLTGKNPIAAIVWSVSGDIEPGPAGAVTGDASHYRLRAPSDKWHMRKPEAAKKDNALADRWMVRPDVDAHVLVIAEKVPGMLVMPDALTDVVLDNAKRAATAFEVVDRDKLKTLPEEGRLVHTKSTTGGLEIESLTGVVAVYEHGYQIIAFAPRKSYAEVEADLRSIVESFELPTDARPGLPPDVDPTPVSQVEGLAQKYTISAPSDRWYLRHDEAAKKDNPLADRWLVRPDKDAHVFVLAEEAPGAVVDIDKYTEAIEDVIKTKLSGTILAKEPLKTAPKIGRLLHAKASVNGMQLEYYYGLYAEGERAFQIITFAREDVFASLKDDLLKSIETFQMPPTIAPASTKKP